MTNWAQAERRVLVTALRDLGPDAPTACPPWATQEMAAHLYIRERRPDAAPGVILPGPFANYAERTMASVLRVHSYDQVVDKIASGPPLPLRPVDGLINLFEFFVHAEDVRRPNGGQPRDLPAEQEQVMWRRLRSSLRPMFRRAKGIRVEFVTPRGDHAAIGDGPTVALHAPVGELVLYAFNRKHIAQVAVTGDVAAAERLAQAPLGP